MTDGVFIDRSFKAEPVWAVVWQDQLLPVRFATEEEGALHLYALQTGRPIVSRRGREAEAA